MNACVDFNNLISKTILDYQLLSGKELKNGDICFDPISFIIETGLNTQINLNELETDIFNPNSLVEHLSDLFFENYYNVVEDRYIEKYYYQDNYDSITEQQLMSDNTICPTEDGFRFIQLLFNDLANFLVSNYQITHVNNIVINQVYPNNNLPHNVNNDLFKNIFVINFNA